LNRGYKIKRVKNRYRIIYEKNSRPIVAAAIFMLLMVYIAGHMGSKGFYRTEDEKLIIQGAKLQLEKRGQIDKSSETEKEKMRCLLGEVLAKQLGKPYVYNEEGPESFDCSGLVKYAYGQIGIELPRVAEDQAETGIVVDGALKFGDVLFFGESPEKITHVGIYTGYGYMIHAPRPGDVVKLERIDTEYLKKTFVKAVRII